MEISGKKIVQGLQKIEKQLVARLKKKKKQIKLCVFLVGDSADQLSFVKIKQKVAKKLGIKFEFIRLKKVPSFEAFIHLLKESTNNPEITGVLIQQPLPSQLQTDSIYDFIPLPKEVEGHRHKSPYTPPIASAVLTIIKYIYGKGRGEDLIIDINKDKVFFKKILRSKKIVLIGRGLTGGQLIGKTLSSLGINYINIHSKTPNSVEYYKQADIIITAVGKKILFPEMLKPDVILINVGIRKERGKFKGDYDDKEIKNIASFYTPTPGGIGPIDVFYLYKNLIEAAKSQ